MFSLMVPSSRGADDCCHPDHGHAKHRFIVLASAVPELEKWAASPRRQMTADEIKAWARSLVELPHEGPNDAE